MLPADRTRNTSDLKEAGRDQDAAERLVPVLWDELRSMAAHYLRDERRNHTLQPTALVNEAYVRLIDSHAVEPDDRTYFLALAARTMRRILVDHARRKNADRRGGGAWRRITLAPELLPEQEPVDLVAFHDVLENFAAIDPRASQVIELRFFGGLTNGEVATVLGVSERTVDNDWFTARAWLTMRLQAVS